MAAPSRDALYSLSRSATMSRRHLSVFTNTAGPSRAPSHTRSVASSSPAASPKQPSPSAANRLPKQTLRNLVDLHHHSSTFLRDPSHIPAGFKTAFKSIQAPSPQPYDTWAGDILATHARRGEAGLSNLRLKVRDGVGGVIDKGNNPPAAIQRSRSAWTGEDSWEKVELEERLSEREIRVKEALYGTWERAVPIRGRRAEVQIGLDGMEEYLEAKGENVQDSARKWKARHEAA